MNAEVISIGDEIASGQLLDTNGQWLSTRLGDLGIRVLFHATVGDDIEAQADVFRHAIERADVVIVTGGLGPTADDLTRDALAAASGRPLELHEEWLEHIRRLFARHGWEMPKQNESQAMFPRGSRVIHNPNGTAPGIEMEIARDGNTQDGNAQDGSVRTATGVCRLFALPGVPAEMRQMWDASVCRSLRESGGGRRVILHKKVNCFGAGESRIEEMLPDMIRRERKPTVGITASRATIILRISAEGDSEEECLAAMGPTIKTIHDCLGDLVFGQDDEQLQDAVVRLLRQRGETLSTGEWGTAGLGTRWLRAAADDDVCDDASCDGRGRFLGGVVGCGEGLRAALDLPKDVLLAGFEDGTAGKEDNSKETAEELARQMAIACRGRFSSDHGLAIGPFSVPSPGDAEQPRVFAALATSGGVLTESLPYASHPSIRETFFAKHALNLVRLTLL